MTSRYDPFEEMDRLFDQMRRSMQFGRGAPALTAGTDTSMLSASDANIGLESTGDGFVVTADLPGFEKSDIDLRFDDGVLTIAGSVDVTDESESGWSRHHRQVNETLAIPGDVLENEISASYRNGVLEVRLPTEDVSDDDEHRIDIE